MSKIDKVELFPFSPLKLLHETRKLTAAQAKFLVALMCLYFERGGSLEWLSGREEEKKAALYAPYCGVTKKTFIKMIDALEDAGVIYLNDCGQIVPKFADEIRQAVKDGTHQILNCDETDAGVKVKAVAEAIAPRAQKPVAAPVTQEAREGVAAEAEARFQGGDAGRGCEGDNKSTGEVQSGAADGLFSDAPADEDDSLILEHIPSSFKRYSKEECVYLLRKYFPEAKNIKGFCRLPEEERTLCLTQLGYKDATTIEQRLFDAKYFVEEIEKEAMEYAEKNIKKELDRQRYIADEMMKAVLKATKYDFDEPIKKYEKEVIASAKKMKMDAMTAWLKTPEGIKAEKEMRAAMAAMPEPK